MKVFSYFISNTSRSVLSSVQLQDSSRDGWCHYLLLKRRDGAIGCATYMGVNTGTLLAMGTNRTFSTSINNDTSLLTPFLTHSTVKEHSRCLLTELSFRRARQFNISHICNIFCKNIFFHHIRKNC